VEVEAKRRNEMVLVAPFRFESAMIQVRSKGIMETTRLKIEGMMCEACVAHVTKALQGVTGVRQATVDLRSGDATVRHENAESSALVHAASEAGYEAQVDG
jgi:Cu2+-exporting ATPase